MSRKAAAGTRLWLVLLLLPALFLRALVPPGFMPAAEAGSSSLTMAMCPAHAALPGTTPEPMPAPAPDPASKHHDAPCVFAAASGLAPLPAVPLVLALEPRSILVDSLPLVAAPPRHASRAHGARAPPLRG